MKKDCTIGLCAAAAYLAVVCLNCTACETDNNNQEIVTCGDWLGVLVKELDKGELVHCKGTFAPGCYFEDGEPVNDETMEDKLDWSFSTDENLTLLSVEWNEAFKTENLATFEADIVNGDCAEGTLRFVLQDSTGTIACDSMRITRTSWDNANEQHI